MINKIPAKVTESELTALLKNAGLERFKDPGKTSETWKVPDYGSKLLMILTTDRISIFDLVLNCLVEKKGEVITAMTVLAYKDKGILDGFKNHLLAYGQGIDSFLPKFLQGNSELQKHAIIVRELNVTPLECIARGYLTGSGFEAYEKTGGEVYGHFLPSGLCDGAKLSHPIFTPTTKAEDEHDAPLNYENVSKVCGAEYEETTLEIYKRLFAYCEKRRIILADAKFEFALDATTFGKTSPDLILVDKFSPDEARFWDKEEWIKAIAQKKAPQGYDKQPVREWGKKKGMNNLDPKNPKHITFVHSINVPKKITSATTKRYLKIFRRLAGMNLEEYQQQVMGISE